MTLPRWSATAALLVLTSVATADIGPENTVLVVNGLSPQSAEIADFYAQKRGIHPNNIIQLVGVPDGQETDLATFKAMILRPLLQEIDERGLGRQVRLIAYSAGFPTAIGISEHTQTIEDAGRKKLFTPVASLNGATFHFPHLLADRTEYLQPGSNFYARGPMTRSFANPFATEPEPFNEAADLFRRGEFTKSASVYRKLLERDPDQHPIALLLAKSAVAAGDENQATLDLLAAIRAGWWSRGYVETDPQLTQLLDRPGVAGAVAKLPDGLDDWQPAVGFVGHRVWTPMAS